MTRKDYESYCLSVEPLIKPLGRIDGADVECWLFPDQRSEWRLFLKQLDWEFKEEQQ